MTDTNRLFPHLDASCALIGMVHLPPLPATPRWGGSMSEVLDTALRDADALLAGGCDALLVENMGDVPYIKHSVHPATAAAIALAVDRVSSLGHPVGLQVLAGANTQALSIAATCGASFIRVEGFAYAHVADEGWIDACAGPLLRERQRLGSSVAIWADVQKKHSAHAVTADLPMHELAAGYAFCGADALIVTGRSTGLPTSVDDVREARRSSLPVAVGSGVAPDNIQALAVCADALIVGSWLKHDGHWRNGVDVQRVQTLRTLLDSP